MQKAKYCMRELIDIVTLTEKALSIKDLQKTDPATGKLKYLPKLKELIKTGTPLEVVAGKHDVYGAAVKLSQASITALNNAVKTGENPKLTTVDKKPITLSSLEKSAAITGAEKPNIGHIGEICLGVATAAKFAYGGNEVGPMEFVTLATQMKLEQVLNKNGKIGDSLRLTYTGQIPHKTGKIDKLEVIIVCPGFAIKMFMKYVNEAQTVPMSHEVRGVILSALDYARNAEKIKAGLELTARDPNINTVQVVSDGISSNTGTKADLYMDIDGKKINLLSVKTGPSQLGQASGHDWLKQHDFFKTVFNINVASYKQYWGATNQEHLATLQMIWKNVAIPKITSLLVGNNSAKEKALVKLIANGLIRYSNNYDINTGAVDTVDIVKLIVDPSNPGYSLLRIDHKLTQALDRTNLFAVATKDYQGVNIYGRTEIINKSGDTVLKDILLCKFRSYYSSAGDVVRTVIEGGPLLDVLALQLPVVASTSASTATPASAPDTSNKSKIAESHRVPRGVSEPRQRR